jgi:lipopolysaccharide/colanic/teichoic acid biosynthesis glycosyltransferase
MTDLNSASIDEAGVRSVASLKKAPQSTGPTPVPRMVRRVDWQHNILDRSDLTYQLQVEKRRAERCRDPLSVVLFRYPGTGSDRFAGARKLAVLLLSTKRETDLVGYVADNVIALVLPHTCAHGASVVAGNASREFGDPRLTVETATYPDQIFESLVSSEAVGAESQPLLLDGATQSRPVARMFKRIADIVGAAGLLVLASPFMVATALAIAATSPGPVIFRQARLGQRGVPFVFYKFRSMHTDADDQIHREYVGKLIDGRLDEVNQGGAEDPHYKIKADPRVTRVGRFIRKTSIDELPQLFNVLKGDMSLVGPRPPVPYEVQKYQPWHLARVLDIKPGITGLWQVEGRSKVSFDEMVRLDLRYQREWSLWLDVKILIKTVAVVLRGEGAD